MSSINDGLYSSVDETLFSSVFDDAGLYSGVDETHFSSLFDDDEQFPISDDNDGFCFGVDETYFSSVFDDDEQFPIPDDNDGLYSGVDETYFFSLFDDDEQLPISDDNDGLYSGVDETYFSSLFDDDEQLLGKGNAAETSRLFCPICMDQNPAGEMFQIINCSHSFCMECMGTYISTGIKDHISGLNCPDPNCRAKLDPSNCRGIVPKEVLERWEDALCEAMILASEKFYCPYNNCSALLLADDRGGKVIQSECPSCHRLFCAICKVPWHDGFSCEEFQSDESSRKLDEMVVDHARSMKWQKCPNCKFYVEKKTGCNHITCRCRHEFCYVCGDKWWDVPHSACFWKLDSHV